MMMKMFFAGFLMVCASLNAAINIPFYNSLKDHRKLNDTISEFKTKLSYENNIISINEDVIEYKTYAEVKAITLYIDDLMMNINENKSYGYYIKFDVSKFYFD